MPGPPHVGGHCSICITDKTVGETASGSAIYSKGARHAMICTVKCRVDPVNRVDPVSSYVYPGKPGGGCLGEGLGARATPRRGALLNMHN